MHQISGRGQIIRVFLTVSRTNIGYPKKGGDLAEFQQVLQFGISAVRVSDFSDGSNIRQISIPSIPLELLTSSFRFFMIPVPVPLTRFYFKINNIC